MKLSTFGKETTPPFRRFRTEPEFGKVFNKKLIFKFGAFFIFLKRLAFDENLIQLTELLDFCGLTRHHTGDLLFCRLGDSTGS
jgi:hypothetical protein